MKVTLNRVNDNFHFEGAGTSPVKVHMDGGPAIGGEDAGARPMELVLMAVASCAAIDFILILKKQKQSPADIQIEVTGERENAGQVPSPFSAIHVLFKLKGESFKEPLVDKALQMSVHKLCSVHEMLKGSVNVTADWEWVK